MRRALAAAVVVAAAAALAGGTSAAAVAPAPSVFHVAFRTTKGTFVATFHRSWAPHGADRVYRLVQDRFFDGVSFFRVVPGFVVQFGISPDPAVSKAWATKTIPDDRVRQHNTTGTISFAAAGPGTRTTQLFVDLADNRALDSQGFAPVGRVTRGMKVVDSLYGGYGEAPSQLQPQIETKGAAFLRKRFPKLDRILTARLTR